MTKNIKRETHPQVRLRNRIVLGAVACTVTGNGQRMLLLTLMSLEI